MRHFSFWPWHILYLRPEPHGHGAFLPVPGKVRPSAHGVLSSSLFGRLETGTLPSAWLIGAGPATGSVDSPAPEAAADSAIACLASVSSSSSSTSPSAASTTDSPFSSGPEATAMVSALSAVSSTSSNGLVGGGDLLDVDVEQQLDGLLLNGLDHGVVHLVAFALVFDQRVALAHATQADAVP